MRKKLKGTRFSFCGSFLRSFSKAVETDAGRHTVCREHGRGEAPWETTQVTTNKGYDVLPEALEFTLTKLIAKPTGAIVGQNFTSPPFSKSLFSSVIALLKGGNLLSSIFV